MPWALLSFQPADDDVGRPPFARGHATDWHPIISEFTSAKLVLSGRRLVARAARRKAREGPSEDRVGRTPARPQPSCNEAERMWHARQ